MKSTSSVAACSDVRIDRAGMSTSKTIIGLLLVLLETFIMSTLSVPVLQLDASQRFLEQPTKNPASPLPVPNPTRSFWLDSPGANPLAKEGSEGPLPTDVDICIIGSGITGVSAAYHLAKQLDSDSITKPLKAVILEARDFC